MSKKLATSDRMHQIQLLMCAQVPSRPAHAQGKASVRVCLSDTLKFEIEPLLNVLSQCSTLTVQSLACHDEHEVRSQPDRSHLFVGKVRSGLFWVTLSVNLGVES